MTTLQTTNWEKLSPIKSNGETGFSLIKTSWLNEIQIRMIEYSVNYKADHWCSKGHIVFCVSGEYELHLKDGSVHQLSEGTSYQTFDDDANPHMAISKNGCKLFVVDGKILTNK